MKMYVVGLPSSVFKNISSVIFRSAQFFAALFITAVFSSCSVKLNNPSDSDATSTASSTTTTTAVAGDTTAPTVTAVVSTNADGGYVTGDVITIQVTFSEAVTVDTTGGTPYITLETGTVDQNATYASGSTTTVLTFTYTLASGDQSADLDYTTTTALSANSGTIKDAAGNNATLTLAAVAATNSISDNQDVVVCAQTTHTALGSGTRASPHLLCQANQLASVGATSGDWGLHYKLMHNIDLTGYTHTADGTQWIPIGSSAIPFTGTFDGNSKTISGFTYTNAAKDYLGIFGYVKGSGVFITDLTLSGINITGGTYVGGLAGVVINGPKIFRVSSSGSITGAAHTGGLIGSATNLTVISGCSSSVSFGGCAGNSCGGLIGTVSYAWISESFATGSVIVTGQYVGGLVGNVYRSMFINTYATGNVSSTNAGGNIGGLLGRNNGGNIRNSFATGNVTGNQAGNTVGLFQGYDNNYGLTNNFYNSAATCTNTGAGGTCNVTGGTAIDLGTQPTYFNDKNNAPLSSWGFTNIWVEQTGAKPILSPGVLDATVWGTCATHQSDAPFAGGTGTIHNPYLICTASQLNSIGSSSTYWSNVHFKLMADIDMAGYTGTGYNPIGSSASSYIGFFDGNRKVVSNLTYSSGVRDYLGFFGRLSGVRDYLGFFGRLSGVASQLALTNVNLTGRTYVGGLAGSSSTLGAIDFYVTGSVTGTTGVGGIAGISGLAAVILNGYTTANVTGTSNYVGGTIGEVGNGDRINIVSLGSVTAAGAATNVGRFSGNNIVTTSYYNSNSTCTNCTYTVGTAVDVGGADPSTYFYDKTKAPLSTWDFTNTWLENAADYPTFQP
jgi:hypothetical protein